MKTFKLALLVMLLTGSGVLTVALLKRSPEIAVIVKRQTKRVSPRTPMVSPPQKIEIPIVDVASTPAKMIRVGAKETLATIDHRPVFLKSLVPMEPGQEEQTMTSEEYESRLERAIEIELTFRAAAARRVELTTEQVRRVAAIALKHKAQFQEFQRQGITWTSATSAQIEFEQHLTTALLLQQNLVALEARVAPDSDPIIQARYEQARSETLSRLRANCYITVSVAEL